MEAESLGFTTKELTDITLPDFERLFEKHPAPGAFTCWCLYHHRAGPLPKGEEPSSRGRRAARNRERKRRLVADGRSHGILVYWKGEAVGWCQYGSREELPRFDNNRSHRNQLPIGETKRMWRITCFTVEKRFRRRGVARMALKAAMDAIRRRGGDLVEAYPITRWGAYREYLGTVSMFRREGFEIVGRFGKSNVVMRRVI